MHTETQPLTGIQGQDGPGGLEGRGALHPDRREVQRTPEPDHKVEAVAPRRCRRLRRGREGHGGGTERRRTPCQDRRTDHGVRFLVQCARSHERHERKTMIDRTHPVSVTRQACILDLSRSSVYYEPVGTGEGDLALMVAMDEIHLQLPFYRIRRIRGELLDRGRCGRRTSPTCPWRGASATSRRSWTGRTGAYSVGDPPTHRTPPSASRPWQRAFPNARSSAASNTTWLERSSERSRALDKYESVQDSHFTSAGFTGLAHSHGIQVSIEGRGRWMDNVFIERLWGGASNTRRRT